MKFKIGQTVELIENSEKVALIGATAIVESIGDKYINVVWKTDFGTQMNGGYLPSHFKPLFTKGQQLLFSFMLMDAMEST